MKKIETIWHHILFEALTTKECRHTQKEVAAKLHCSISTVHHALRIPESIGAIRKGGKFFVLQDVKKLLYYWASMRVLSRDIFYETSSNLPVRAIEGNALPGSTFACFSAATHYLKEPPADYDKVYFYIQSKDLSAFEKRFPKAKGTQRNVIALKRPDQMERYGDFTSLPQTFVDIWNLGDWYAQEFSTALEHAIDALLP